MKARWAVVCDFDGTITTRDIAEAILERFTGDAWKDIEAEYREGKIGSRIALAKQFANVHASSEEVVAYALGIAALRPHFKEFAAFCHEKDVPLLVLSEGLEIYIEPILRRAGANVRYEANTAAPSEQGMKILYHDDGMDCELCGICKFKRVEDLRDEGYKVMYIGDGYSDLCAARNADLVLAAGYLRERLGGLEFEDFAQAAEVLEGLLCLE
ncbi:MAG: MtnX-like HAD-IB family phosphatase [Candidatus Thermoplasmatota archaeon]